jgi:hypothetical protein
MLFITQWLAAPSRANIFYFFGSLSSESSGGRQAGMMEGANREPWVLQSDDFLVFNKISHGLAVCGLPVVMGRV